MTKLFFHYDISSPYTYLATTQIEALASDCGAELVWVPTFLGGVFKATGNAPPANVPARARYLFKDLNRWAAYYRVPFKFPTNNFPVNSIRAMRVLTAAKGNERVELSHKIFHAYWAEGKDPTDETVLTDIVGEELMARSLEQDVKDELRAATDAAVDKGMFGAPTFFVGDEMYFGNDRLPFLEQKLRDLKG